MKSSNQLTEVQTQIIDEILNSRFAFFSVKLLRDVYLPPFGLELSTISLIRLGDGRTIVRSDVVAKLIAEKLLTGRTFGLDVSDDDVIDGKSGTGSRIREATRRILRAVKK